MSWIVYLKLCGPFLKRKLVIVNKPENHLQFQFESKNSECKRYHIILETVIDHFVKMKL